MALIMFTKAINYSENKKIPIPLIALCSRLLICMIQLVSNHIIPDHDAHVFLSPKNEDPDGQTTSIDTLIESLLGGFNRWDGQYFLHIAEYGYTYENTLAFYPLYPYCVKLVANVVHWMLCGAVSYHYTILLVAITLNIIIFIESARTLYLLSLLIYKDEKRCRLIVILYCFNPASIFFSAPYTESFFACLSFKVMLKLHLLVLEKMSYTVQSIIPLLLSVLCRSNGLINFGFLLFFTIKMFGQNYSIKLLLKLKIIVILSFLVYASLQYYYYNLFCEKNMEVAMPDHVRKYGTENNYVLVGSGASPWCNYEIPLSYSYIQNHYWSVGLFQYYHWKQIPNFVLASPIIFIFIWYIVNYIKCNIKLFFNLKFIIKSNHNLNVNLLPYVIHSAFLVVFAILMINIQVVTRLLCSSSPMLYWIGSEILYDNKKIGNKFRKFFVLWFISYFVVGTVMFCNFLPWT